MDNIRYLIEALRGGGESRFKNGQMVGHTYGARPGNQGTAGAQHKMFGAAMTTGERLRAAMPKGLRKQQLHNMEVKAGTVDKDSEY